MKNTDKILAFHNQLESEFLRRIQDKESCLRHIDSDDINFISVVFRSSNCDEIINQEYDECNGDVSAMAEKVLQTFQQYVQVYSDIEDWEAEGDLVRAIEYTFTETEGKKEGYKIYIGQDTYREQISEICYNWWGHEAGWSKEQMDNFIEQLGKEYNIIVLTFNRKLAGFVMMETTELPEELCIEPMISNLYIDPEHRGKELSKVLMEEAEDVYKSKSYDGVYIVTEHIELYEKMGYTYKRTLSAEECGEDKKSNRLYYKRLNTNAIKPEINNRNNIVETVINVCKLAVLIVAVYTYSKYYIKTEHVEANTNNLTNNKISTSLEAEKEAQMAQGDRTNSLGKISDEDLMLVYYGDTVLDYGFYSYTNAIYSTERMRDLRYFNGYTIYKVQSSTQTTEVNNNNTNFEGYIKLKKDTASDTIEFLKACQNMKDTANELVKSVNNHNVAEISHEVVEEQLKRITDAEDILKRYGDKLLSKEQAELSLDIVQQWLNAVKEFKYNFEMVYRYRLGVYYNKSIINLTRIRDFYSYDDFIRELLMAQDIEYDFYKDLQDNGNSPLKHIDWIQRIPKELILRKEKQESTTEDIKELKTIRLGQLTQDEIQEKENMIPQEIERIKEEQRIQEERRIQEEIRLEEERRLQEEQRIQEELQEELRIQEEQRIQEELRIIEEQRIQEENNTYEERNEDERNEDEIQQERNEDEYWYIEENNEEQNSGNIRQEESTNINRIINQDTAIQEQNVSITD